MVTPMQCHKPGALLQKKLHVAGGIGAVLRQAHGHEARRADDRAGDALLDQAHARGLDDGVATAAGDGDFVQAQLVGDRLAELAGGLDGFIDLRNFLRSMSRRLSSLSLQTRSFTLKRPVPEASETSVAKSPVSL